MPPILSVNKYTYLSLNYDKLSALYTKQFIFISEEKTNLENNQIIHLPQEEEDGSYNATAHHYPHPLRPLRDAPGKHILEPCSTPIFCKFDQYLPSTQLAANFDGSQFSDSFSNFEHIIVRYYLTNFCLLAQVAANFDESHPSIETS